jgi:hypothetical protein
MKNSFIALLLVSLFSISSFAQKNIGITGENNWFINWTNFKPAKTEYRESNKVLTGIIDKDTKLTRQNTYNLVGVVYVTNKAVLTIEPGTVIRGDKETCGTLVITKGAKIIAEGTETDPIVFTSNKSVLSRRPGDWGGIVVLGDAPINRLGGETFLDFGFDQNFGFYGGQNAQSNSGILKYVRIEYAGHKFNATKELNGLSLAGIGKETILNFIQISFSNDDSFECYGGDVVCNNLISYLATDDDFDYTQGVQAVIANSVAIRNPFSSDRSGSRCFEIDSYDKKELCDTSKKITKVTANNITLLNTEQNNQGLVREAIYISDSCYFSLSNSVVDGFSFCTLLHKSIEKEPINIGKINLQNIQVNQSIDIVKSENEAFNKDLEKWYLHSKFANFTTSIKSKDLYFSTDFSGSPDLRLLTNNDVVSSK